MNTVSNKVLVSISTYNQPAFLEMFTDSFQRTDPGYPCDLLILDNSNTDPKSLKLLDKISKKFRVETKPNYGRAQGGYQYAWENNKEYAYHFFLHDDSAFIRDNWLKVAVDRINDQSLESNLKVFHLSPHTFRDRPIGKVGFQTYEWGTKYAYLRTGYNQVFHYMDPIAEFLDVQIPSYYQHINDDKILYSKECLTSIGHIWNIEDWKQKEVKDKETWTKIHEWFKQNGMHNDAPFQPIARYGSNYNIFQAICEFLNDIEPMMNGFRTHCVIGDGYCQEESGWSSFRGNEYIVHYGDHVVFKRLSLLLKHSEEAIRERFKDKTFLTICNNLIKKDSATYMEKLK